MLSKGWKWVLGLVYIIIVAAIWIAASFVVQSVVDSGVSPFLITYICNSLFVVYIPIVEIARYIEDSVGNLWFKFGKESDPKQLGDATKTALLNDGNSSTREECSNPVEFDEQARMVQHGQDIESETETGLYESELLAGEENSSTPVGEAKVLVAGGKGLDAKGRWTRTRVAKIGLLISPFWFLAQLTFNFSLKYTTVTANTILSSVSSLFTFLVSLAFLGEKFTWVKLFSVLLCMAGTVIVTLGDSGEGSNAIAYKPLLGDILALVSAGLYAVYITLIRQKIPDEDKGEGKASMAQFLGFLGLCNLLIFLPVALVLNFTKLEPFHRLSWTQVGLIVGKGLLDNVLSDYLWAKAVLLTTTTVATAGLTIQVPMAAVVDSITGHAPNIMDYLGGAAIMLGFVGINLPENVCCRLWGGQGEHEAEADLVPSLADKSTTIS